MDEQSIIAQVALLIQTDHKTEPHILAARTIHPRSYLTWKEDEDNLLYLVRTSTKFTIDQIAVFFQRTSKAIESRLDFLNLNQENSSKERSLISPMNDNNKKNDPTRNIIHYWRTSLADADKIGLDVKEIQEGKPVVLDDIKKGQLQPQYVAPFFKAAENAIKKKNKARAKYKQPLLKEIVNELPVIIAPMTAKKIFDHGRVRKATDNTPSLFFPLWLVAILTKDGKLKPVEEKTYPWIERRCLTPNEQKYNFPIIGDVSQVDKYYTLHSDIFGGSDFNWQALFNFAMNLYLKLINDAETDIFITQHYLIEEKGYILPYSDQQGSTQNIIKTYDQYLTNTKREPSSLFHEFCSLNTREVYPDKQPADLFLLNKFHVGQTQAEYPLSTSQRISLSYLYDDVDNNIFTIHGPPGTGKTTLLLSVIASQWIQAAIAKQPPPIIVAASTNNLAVTNILDSFKKITAVERWLPDVTSYGWYLAPSQRVEDAINNNYLYQTKDNPGSTATFYTTEYSLIAEKFFLEKFNLTYKKIETNIENCQQYLHRLILEKHTLLNNVILFAHAAHQEFLAIINQHGDINTINNKIEHHSAEKDRLDNELKKLNAFQEEWLTYQQKQLLWLQLFSWLPFVKQLLANKIRNFTSRYDSFFNTIEMTVSAVNNVFNNRIKEIKSTKEQTIIDLNALLYIKEKLEALEIKKKTFEQQLGFEFSLENTFDLADSKGLLAKLDTSLRYELFILATHYWEAAWLKNCAALADLPYDTNGRKQCWQTKAMLTPCFVTTLHSGTAFFQYRTPAAEFETLSEFIDLLIIDEAGQVMPAIAGAMVSTAKKILLVGDALQIQPVFKLPPSVDLANTKKFNLCINDDDYERLKAAGVLSSGNTKTGQAFGNLIYLGQRKAKYHLANHTLPGLLLKEHRRCAAEIISYCNKLCYNNQLIPLTKEVACEYPRMGYAHIKGETRRENGSLFNPAEAEAIAYWIVKNEADLLRNSGKQELDDCIGIVTPFAAQARAIKKTLDKYNLHIKKVGTVHSLQGAEKDFIIFSSVYTTADDVTTYFFDRASNMLNVAVSRAKMSFLVFGDMDIFDKSGSISPSSLLATYLFEKEENELLDIIQPKYSLTEIQDVQQLNTLEQHRMALKNAFQRARQEIHIVSPYLTTTAIKFDEITTIITKYSNSITINIYTDPSLNTKRTHDFSMARKLLSDAGAQVFLVRNVHSKIIAIDDKIIIEGSFNWLSASRDNPQFIREECSMEYAGEQAAKFIQLALEPIKNKIINPSLAMSE